MFRFFTKEYRLRATRFATTLAAAGLAGELLGTYVVHNRPLRPWLVCAFVAEAVIGFAMVRQILRKEKS